MNFNKTKKVPFILADRNCIFIYWLAVRVIGRLAH